MSFLFCFSSCKFLLVFGFDFGEGELLAVFEVGLDEGPDVGFVLFALRAALESEDDVVVVEAGAVGFADEEVEVLLHERDREVFDFYAVELVSAVKVFKKGLADDSSDDF